jgi:hypothetical protein
MGPSNKSVRLALRRHSRFETWDIDYTSMSLFCGCTYNGPGFRFVVVPEVYRKVYNEYLAKRDGQWASFSKSIQGLCKEMSQREDITMPDPTARILVFSTRLVGALDMGELAKKYRCWDEYKDFSSVAEVMSPTHYADLTLIGDFAVTTGLNQIKSSLIKKT